jgi:hypothetical protein
VRTMARNIETTKLTTATAKEASTLRISLMGLG